MKLNYHKLVLLRAATLWYASLQISFYPLIFVLSRQLQSVFSTQLIATLHLSLKKKKLKVDISKFRGGNLQSTNAKNTNLNLQEEYFSQFVREGKFNFATADKCRNIPLKNWFFISGSSFKYFLYTKYFPFLVTEDHKPLCHTARILCCRKWI